MWDVTTNPYDTKGKLHSAAVIVGETCDEGVMSVKRTS
jgi:hypothetical protein